MKDYYAILGVDKKADCAEIKKQYRKRAMQYHPDRNPDNPEAELKFKELAEAYGVLTDPVKKKEYDRYKATGFGGFNAGSGTSQGSGFHYSQEDILKDLFNDPRFQNMFQTLIRDFQRSGFRGDSRFFKQTMFGGKGKLLGSLFIFGSMAGAKMMVNSATARGTGKNILGSIVKSVTSLLTGGGDKGEKSSKTDAGLDLHYEIRLSPEELQQGKWIQVLTGEAGEKIRVKIPGQSKPGQTLRVKNKGKIAADVQRGHLFIHL